jgi:soluble lytic murein transglycosylase
MHGIALKLALPLVSLAGIAAGSFATQTASPSQSDQLDRYRTQMANMPAAQAPMTTQNPFGPTDPAIAAAIAQWTAIRQTDALPFDSYAGFLLAHPGWPGEAAARRAAERKAATASPGSVVAFFRRFPPQSASAGVAYAQALAAQGSIGEANDAARTAWRRGALSPIEEGAILARFASALTPDDHDQRMDALLWAGSTAAAARQIGYVSAGRRQVFATRLAFRSNDPQAATLAVNDDPALMGDAGYLADRATWLRTNNAEPSARALLARPRTLTVRPGNVEKWYEVNLALARGAAADRQWQTAYDIARQIDDAYAPGTVIADRPYGERDDYTSLAWLGGQAALKGLGRPADAAVLFDRYGKGSNAPQTRSKGLFWAGRAFARAGQPSQASNFYGSAAAYRDQFYGQLAAEASGRALAPPPPVDTTPVDPATAAAFARRETVRAAQLLGNVGQWQDQSLFLRQIATDAKTSADHKLANDLSRQLNRPDLAVMIGRSALVNGLSDYAAAGFPTVAVPAGYESNWTLIHAIARQESQFDRAAISSAGARGLMQLMPATAREQAGKMGMVHDVAALTQDPQLSIRLGSSYFDRTYARFNSYPMAIAAYNAGGGNVNKWLGVNGDPRIGPSSGGVDMVDWIEAIPFSETRNYVQRVLENAVVYDLMNPARAKSRGPRPLSWYLGQR